MKSASTQLLERGNALSFHEAMDLLLQQCQETLHELPYSTWKEETIELARECLDWIEAVLKAKESYLDGMLSNQNDYHIALSLRLHHCPRLKTIGSAMLSGDYRDLAM